MAELILGSVVDSIAGQLFSLVSQGIRFGRGVEAELQRLLDIVATIPVVLRDAERSQIESEDVKDWLQKLKDAVYDADDLLDDFYTEVLRRQRVRGGVEMILNEVSVFFSSFSKTARLKEIKERIDAIFRDRFRFQLEGNSNPTGNSVEYRDKRGTYPFEWEPYAIGRDDDIKEVVRFLLNPDFEQNVSVLPIVGIGGLGKTTLARLVFNCENVKEYFQLKLWVCVSTNFNVDNILRKMIRECRPGQDLASLNEVDYLREVLREELDGKRFLLVLDDVWNEDRSKWLKLHSFLMNGARGSKILATTRTPQVARTMTPTYHELGGLSEDDSLKLLMRMAMKQEHEWRNRNLEVIAKEILKKCAGVPLAIMTIGRLLLFLRNSEEDWLDLKNNDFSRIIQEEGDIMPSLKLTYDFLPPHLKRCFSYCSVFPKDYELDPWELIHLWMAHGFIKAFDRNMTLEEVGYDCFRELLSRSFFHDVETDSYGNIVRCKMHVLMHDLAQLVAGNECITIDSSYVERLPDGARHLSAFRMDVLKKYERDERIRSLLLFVGKRDRIEIGRFDVSCFTNLRALRLRDAEIREISSSIDVLKHLRSLDLSGNYELSCLPNSISSLCNLETLNLRGCRSLSRLPMGIMKLVNLMHLDLSGCFGLIHMPRGVGNLINLQLLGVFVVGEKSNPNVARFNELSKLTRLRKELGIRNLERLGSISGEEDSSFSMEKFALEYLGLHWDRKGDATNDEEVLEQFQPHQGIRGLKIEGYGGVRLSSWVAQLHKLVVVEITDCLQCKHLPPLDHLPFLKRISLEKLRKLEWIELSEISRNLRPSFFQSLEEIELKHLDEFKGWKRRGNRMEGDDIGNEEENSSFMLPTFSDHIQLSIDECPRFSYMQGRRLHLRGTTDTILQQLLGDVECHASVPFSSQLPMAMPAPSVVTINFISFIPLSPLTSITIESVEDVKHLPMELFQSLLSLQCLTIKRFPYLKDLSLRTNLRYLPALETLEISDCASLDLSIEDGAHTAAAAAAAADNDMHTLQLQGHGKLQRLHLRGIHKMESLPGWFQYLSNLQDLRISLCLALKSLPGTLILRLLTTVRSLELHSCPELYLGDLESEDQQDIPNFPSYGLRKLVFSDIRKMKTLPWWVQHLTNLESLALVACRNLKALPEWFLQFTSLKYLEVEDCGELSRRCERFNGDYWPKISHLQLHDASME